MNALQSAFSSHRLNRLMLGFGFVVLAAGALILVSTLVGGSDKTKFGPDPTFRATLPVPSTPLRNAQGRTVRTFWQLDPEIRATIRTFLATAVARKHLGDAWDVVAPSMKVGYTYKRWKNASALPVIPYPVEDVDKSQYYLDYAFTKEILVDVGIAPRKEAKLRSMTFQLGLVPVGKGAHKRWLVDYWMPRWTPLVPSLQ